MRIGDLNDAQFTEYVAGILPTDAVPEEGVEAVVDRCVSIGIIPQPPGSALLMDVLMRCIEAACTRC